ncbi:MAG: beta-glucosidase [Halieaceae bacterium]|jgi:beta-glucosidase
MDDRQVNAQRNETRLDTLLATMSLQQKVGQMVQTERMAITPEEVKEFHIGSVLSGGGSCPGENTPQDWIDMNDAYWAASMEADETHLAIPIIYGIDAVHGHNNVFGATIFPHNIGLGATRDPALLERVAQATAREILATGVDWTFAPVLAVARDLRWGRTYESYSESPELVAGYAASFVRGLQSDLGDDGVVACVKHWVGDGGTTDGMDQGNTKLSLAELKRLHMTPYYPALDEGALTVMSSLSSWNTEKCHGQHQLLTDVLKGELGFEGYVISDWDGIDYLADHYFDAIALGVNAGIDMFMVTENWKPFIDHLLFHVKQGSVPMARIDDAVRRILRVKLTFGLFDKPRPAERPWSGHDSFGGTEHREIAREAVRKSQVLLKNSDDMLPLAKDSRILVAGKNADNRGNQCGGFTIAWQGISGNDFIIGGTSIWEGIEKVAPSAVLSAAEFGEDADAAKHDLAIVVIGETPYAEGLGDIRGGDNVAIEPGSALNGMFSMMEPYGNSLDLATLHPEDLQTMQNIAAAGIPMLAIYVGGRPLVINRELELATAFVSAWLPGSEGQGIADVIFGDHPFCGKLSFSWPQIADSSCNVGDKDYNPLFELGYGLSC